MTVVTTGMGAEPGRLSFQICHPDELTAEDIAAWEQLNAVSAAPNSPLLLAQFASRIATARDDVRCLLARTHGRLVGAMAAHVRPLGLLRPIGAPFADCSGPIFEPGCELEVEDLIAGCGMHAYRAANLVVPLVKFDEGQDELAYLIRMDGRTSAEYLEERRAAHPKRMKNFRRLVRKFEAEYGSLELRWGAPDKTRLETLFQWKSEQFQRGGLVDLTQRSSSRAVLDAFATSPYDEAAEFGGFCVELLRDGELLSGHFGVRHKDYFHPWIASFDPKYAAFTPGVLLLYRVLETIDQQGIETYDLADGHEAYKKYFAAPLRVSRPVAISSGTVRGGLQRRAYESWSLLGARNDSSLAARFRRRLDHISACEPSFVQRSGDILTALRKRSGTETAA